MSTKHPEVHMTSEHPRCNDTGRLSRFPCVRTADHAGLHCDSLGVSWPAARGLRPLGYDAGTGKQAYALTEPGGALDKAADIFALEAAATWYALASAMVEGPALSADEANFILARVVESLGEVLPLAAQCVADNPAVDLPLYADSARDIGTALRDMKP